MARGLHNYMFFVLLSLILRALGQIMLYVDGMTGVMESPRAVQFLYKLISASNPLVCKTATKLLVVFVEYNTETNCSKLVTAINDVDKENGVIPWTDVMSVVQKAVPPTAEQDGGGNASQWVFGWVMRRFHLGAIHKGRPLKIGTF